MASINLTWVNLRGPVNRRALRKYAEFWAALHAVGTALEQAEKFAQKAADAQPAKATAGRALWNVASPDEMRAAAKKAYRSLRVISTSAKKWEADLISRDWRS
jgi:hypothetical protein